MKTLLAILIFLSAPLAQASQISCETSVEIAVRSLVLDENPGFVIEKVIVEPLRFSQHLSQEEELRELRKYIENTFNVGEVLDTYEVFATRIKSTDGDVMPVHKNVLVDMVMLGACQILQIQ